MARPGTHSAGERTEIHVSGLDVKPHLVGVGKGFPTLWALFMLVLLMHVEDVAPKGLLASQHPVIARGKKVSQFNSISSHFKPSYLPQILHS